MCFHYYDEFVSGIGTWDLMTTKELRFVSDITAGFLWLALCINPLNAELNPICHLLALLGAHHILHVSRIRVKGAIFSLNVTEEWLDITVPRHV